MWFSFKLVENFIVSPPQEIQKINIRHVRREYFPDRGRGIFRQGEVGSRRNTLCISRLTKRSNAGKAPPAGRKRISNVCPNKKGSGAKGLFAPLIAPIFALSDHPAIGYPIEPGQADRTLRPLARRRARTLRPLEVAILWRKP